MTHVNYFPGVSDPYLEPWALTNSQGVILLIDQNVMILKFLQATLYTKNFSIQRVSRMERFNIVKDKINNSNCTKFKIVSNTISPSNVDLSEFQNKIFTARYEIAKALETISAAFLMSLLSTTFVDAVLVNDENIGTILQHEVSWHGEESTRLKQLLTKINESF